MAKIFAILFLGLASCQQFEKTKASPKPEIDTADLMNPPATIVAAKKYSLDEIYQHYVSKDLLSYIEKTHPAWSLPSENMWYPRLFNRYKTDSSLVNYVSGDFDCNGKKDCALIIDKGTNGLAVVAFLRVDNSFQTVELTDLGVPGEKIEFVLTLYKPGRHQIEDPDLSASDPRQVSFNCNGVGIGKFRELYDGGNDVYYWEQGHLRSCLIEN